MTTRKLKVKSSHLVFFYIAIKNDNIWKVSFDLNDLIVLRACTQCDNIVDLKSVY